MLISSQHAPGIDIDGQMRDDLVEHVIRPLLPEQFADDDFDVLCNPTGAFELGGPHADCGLTGRKIIVDTYGGMSPSRWRRVQRQGPDEGRPLGRVRGAPRRQERRGRGDRAPV